MWVGGRGRLECKKVSRSPSPTRTAEFFLQPIRNRSSLYLSRLPFVGKRYTVDLKKILHPPKTDRVGLLPFRFAALCFFLLLTIAFFAYSVSPPCIGAERDTPVVTLQDPTSCFAWIILHKRANGTTAVPTYPLQKSKGSKNQAYSACNNAS